MIEQFREVWFGTGTMAAMGPDRTAGRAAAKVAQWSLDRAASVLKRCSRGALRFAPAGSGEYTPHEQALRNIVHYLADGDRDMARSVATWLVRRDGVERLLRALEPVAKGPSRLAA